ncbi:MAG TPA: formylglycine-generating enzyme family protein [Gemmatimonadaceae bacterium]|nr:formylglycine-generating enzyme family protein [Gemmatimonadaceae bacterium]
MLLQLSLPLSVILTATLGSHAKPPASMAAIPAGSYRPLYAMPASPRTRVAAFSIDREPVTRGEFLRFVREHPSWRKSAVKPAIAESSYLNDWTSDLDAGDGKALREPIRNVSWFAARAYCESLGKRLPTTDEWEYVAAASETKRDATSDPAFIQRLLASYTNHTGGFRNAFGVSDLHGVHWEWTSDFDGGRMDHMHHHDLNCAGAAMGASDPSNYAAFLRSAFRSGLTTRTAATHLGFRCALR